MDDPAFRDELKSWLRFNARQAMATGDGLYTAASGNPTMPGWLGPLAFSLFFTKGAENDKYARQIETSSGLAIFFAEQEGPQGWVQVGRAAMAFLLEAEIQGLKAAFVNQPVE